MTSTVCHVFFSKAACPVTGLPLFPFNENVPACESSVMPAVLLPAYAKRLKVVSASIMTSIAMERPPL